MAILAGIAVGVVVLISVTLACALVARFLPAGRTREVIGFLPNGIVLLRRLRGHPEMPRRGRLALGAALGYLMSPVQLIPNFIPVVGQTDDFVVIGLAVRYACRRLPRDDVIAAWPGDPAYLNQILGSPRSARSDQVG